MSDLNMDNSKEMSDHSKNYVFDGTTYTYTDSESKKVYSWDLEKNVWIDKSTTEAVEVTSSKSSIPNERVNRGKAKNDEEENDSDDDDDEEEEEKPKAKTQDMSQGTYSYEADAYIYTDATDGTVYQWDEQKKAWFPKIDETFIAYYQMNYGFNAAEQTSDAQPDIKSSETIDNSIDNSKETENSGNKAEKRKLPAEPPKWFDVEDQHNTKVYVTNLPLDISESEFVDLMQKCGLVMKDINTGKMKVKLYADPVSKELKGDALCTYIKKESVVLALQLLDGYDLRGRKIKVERAHFTMKGEAYDPSLKPKKKRKKDKEKMKKIQEKLFAWQPDKLRGERPKHERVVVIKNLFDPTEFDENLGLILEYQQDIREECSKCGSVKKVVVYDKHKEGIAQVWFSEAEAADACVNLLNNRWFSKRLIKAETWDGKTRYRIQETPEEAEIRIKKWEEYLNSNKDEKKEKNSTDDEIGKDNDSDGTRSSAGSGDETDEETKK